MVEVSRLFALIEKWKARGDHQAAAELLSLLREVMPSITEMLRVPHRPAAS